MIPVDPEFSLSVEHEGGRITLSRVGAGPLVVTIARGVHRGTIELTPDQAKLLGKFLVSEAEGT